MHKTAILNRDENINDPSSAADFYVDPAPVKSRRRLILGGLCSLLLLLTSADSPLHTLRSFKLRKSDSSLTSDPRHFHVLILLVVPNMWLLQCTKSIWMSGAK